MCWNLISLDLYKESCLIIVTGPVHFIALTLTHTDHDILVQLSPTPILSLNWRYEPDLNNSISKHATYYTYKYYIVTPKSICVCFTQEKRRKKNYLLHMFPREKSRVIYTLNLRFRKTTLYVSPTNKIYTYVI